MVMFSNVLAVGQTDSTLEALQQVPDKYVKTINTKIDKYTNRVSSKTIKTLTKLAKWETKIKTTLTKLSPETAQRLFGSNQQTFGTVLQQIQKGEAIKLEYRRQYDKYRDDATTSIKYLEKNKQFLDSGLTKEIQATKQKLQRLNSDEDSTQALQQFIKERKKQLVSAAFQYMGKSKYLTKMNKEAFYYAETMKNYKEIFSDEAKTEKLVKGVLHKVPGFSQWAQKNSMLSALFGSPGGGDVADASRYAGLQTRAGVQQIIQQRIGTGGAAVAKQHMQAAQAQLNQLKNKLIKNPFAGNGGGELPDFKPNMQKTKTFLQRLEFGSNIQFARNNSLVPTTADIALTVGYKLNDKSTAGIGAGYKMGLGSIDKIRFSTEGISLRSFIDWKLKKQLYLTGGWEMNYLNKTLQQGVLKPAWQQSALAGLNKKFNIKTKWAKQTQLQLLYDFMAKRNLAQAWVFRVGYTF
jgi:hypothetical protein